MKIDFAIVCFSTIMSIESKYFLVETKRGNF